MGTDDLFHKRRIFRDRDLMRKTNHRSAHEIVLIICEGSKTEPNYFSALRTHLRLNRENIVIHDGHKGSDPLSLVNAAEEAFVREKKRDPEKLGFDRVFVVFDRDTHTTYNNALQKIQGLNKKYKHKFTPIVSIPCFEIWLLLHFGYSTRQYVASGGNSPCDNLIRYLDSHLPGYAKGNVGIFEATKDRLSEAVKNAKQLEAHQESAQTGNPSTKVHQLVEYLLNIQK